ncbi:SWIM zinc finger family protein [Frankia sp. EI5c]|uniref:SWIM zinc finger family protein n=1 Tax=Frankia sp. EI5c TaxID=683316 RepID=UPI00082485A1|nr:SWIM zinc finger family protein [Frankia sp. EI5c]
MPSPPASTLARETVLALAPDPAAARAGERLGGAGNWSGLGTAGEAVWGSCRGSGATPYRVVALTGAEFASTCTCPSRKFPCKHALGLLFLASGSPGLLTGGDEPPGWVSSWLDGRAARADAASARAAQRAAAREAAGESTSSARNQARREARVDAGVAELSQWLSDLARDGLGSAQTRPAAWWERTAARMVDAQAPGLAEAVRDMARIAARGGPDWPDRLTDRLGRLHLLCQGWSRRAELPATLVEVVRDRVGFTKAAADVLGGDRLAGAVDVLGERLFDTGKLRGRRQWLRLAESGQLAQLVSYGAGKQSPPPGLPVLTRVQAEVAAYPGRQPARLALAGTTGAPAPLVNLGTGDLGPGDLGTTAGTWREALSAHTATLSADPWADPVALVIRRITVLPPSAGAPRAAAGRAGARGESTPAGGAASQWLLRDSAGEALPMAAGTADSWGWWLLAVGGGGPLDLVVEWDGFDLIPLSAAPSSPLPGPGLRPPPGDTDSPARAGGGLPGADVGRTADAGRRAGSGSGAEAGAAAAQAAPRPVPGWSEVVDAAVVGVARARVPTLPGLARLVGEATGEGGPPAAADLLRTAALASGARRAGLLPADARGIPAPSPAPPDAAPVLPPQVCRIVETAISGPLFEARAQCLELMAAHGWRAPERLLGDLLALGAREVGIRVAVSRVLGERGRWLAGLHPDGRWVGGQVSAEEWPTASAAERRLLVQELRQRDPAAAAALLRGPADGPAFAPFDQASGAERVAFCEALRTGLGPWDADLLEHALDDRRADVRSAAVATAILLPGSGLARRAAARTEGLVGVTRHGLPGRRVHRLKIDTPAGLTDEMRRDGISAAQRHLSDAESRALLLTAEIARVDPAVWAERTGLTAEQFLAAEVTIAGVTGEPAARLRGALLRAVLRHRHPDWIRALLPRVELTEQARLIDCLPEPTRTEAVALAAGNQPGSNTTRPRFTAPVERAAALLAAIPGPWSPQLSQALVTTLTTLLTEHVAGPQAESYIRRLLVVAAWRADPEVGRQLTQLGPNPPAEAFAGELAELCAVLGARRELRAVLASPPDPHSRTEPTRPARLLVQEGSR